MYHYLVSVKVDIAQIVLIAWQWLMAYYDDVDCTKEREGCKLAIVLVNDMPYHMRNDAAVSRSESITEFHIRISRVGHIRQKACSVIENYGGLRAIPVPLLCADTLKFLTSDV